MRGWGVGVAPDPRSAHLFVPASQLQQETQASRCCLLLVSEDNLQLSCKVRAQVHCGAERGRGPQVSEGTGLAHPLTGPAALPVRSLEIKCWRRKPAFR